MKKFMVKIGIMLFFVSNALNMAAYSDVPINMLPDFKSGENVDVTKNGSNMNIQIQGGANSVGTANWNSFNIGKEAGVNIEFTDQNQTSLNYVDAAGGMSQIYGKFTDSGAGTSTGKIILHNPNGIFFGNGANVNVNSFTATTMNGVYDKDNQILKLTKNKNANPNYGIVVDEGAKINGRKAVVFASNNIDIYNGSKIDTSKISYGPDPSMESANLNLGKVKLVTSDGVNFVYKNGSIDKVSEVKDSTDKMMLYVSGNINSGSIELINSSTNVDSQINTKNGVIKAYEVGYDADGNVLLTSGNKIVTENTEFFGTNNVIMNAKNNISSNKNTIETYGNVTMKSESGNVNMHNTTITADNIILNSDKSRVWTKDSTLKISKQIDIQSNQDGVLLQNTKFDAKNGDINIQAYKDIKSSDLDKSTFKTGKNINIKSSNNIALNDLDQFKDAKNLNLSGYNIEIIKDGKLNVENANLEGFKVTLKSNNDNLIIDGNTTTIKTIIPEQVDIYRIPLGIMANARLEAKNNVISKGTLKTGNRLSVIAGENIDISIDGVSSERGGLYAQAGNNINITKAGTLSIQGVDAGNNLTINADNIIPGNPVGPISDAKRHSTDSSLIPNIKVGGEFISNVKDNYEIISSTGETVDGKYNTEHIIKYGDSNFYLKNKLPKKDETVITPPTIKPRDLGEEILSTEKTESIENKENEIINNNTLSNKLEVVVTPPTIKPRDLGEEIVSTEKKDNVEKTDNVILQ